MVVPSNTLAHNGLQLPEGGDFGVLHCEPITNIVRITNLDLTTEPPLSGRCCYVLFFYSRINFVVIVLFEFRSCNLKTYIPVDKAETSRV